MNGLTWFWRGVVVSVVVGLLGAAPTAHALRAERSLAWLLVVSLGVILAATLTPIHAPNGIDTSSMRPCDLSRHWFASLAEVGAVTDVSLNIALFVPFGFAIALLPTSPRKVGMVAAAASLPMAIEGLQYLVPMLARRCQSGDVIDNLTGLVVGLTAGTLVAWIVSRARCQTRTGSHGGAART